MLGFSDWADIILSIHGIEETAVYQRWVRKGRVQAVREIVLHLGGEKWGPPDERIQTEIEAIADLERLQFLAVRILKASSWDELLATTDPSAPPTKE
jgi:hypothetical protein